MATIDKVSTDKHEGEVICVVYCNNKVFSGGVDGKIKIWDNELNLIRSIDAHEAYIYAMAASSSGKVYSSSSDGCVKFMVPPYDQSCLQELVRCDDAIQAMYCDGDTLYTGDEKGVVTSWQQDKMLFKYSLVEEVKSLAAEQNLMYTVRDWDVVVSEVVSGKSGKYCNKAVMPGKSPLTFVGPVVDGRHTFLAFLDRSGKGLTLVKNLPQTKFETVWILPDCHEMIVNSICADEQHLFSGGYDKTVKGWSELGSPTPRALGEVDVGYVVNYLCCGGHGMVYIAADDGVVRRAKFL